MWFDCIPQADCEELSFQMGEVLGSALINRKDLKSNILKARTKIKDFVRKLFKGGGKKKALSRLNDSDTVKPGTEPNVDPTDVGPGSAAKKPILPDEAWSKNAPHQVTPGTKQTEHFKYNKDTGRLERSVVEYDDYGRQVRRSDHDNHGYGNPNSPDYHSNPHTHTYEYGPGYGPKGKETRTNQ